MQIIPVIDLLNSVVVQAKQGDRKNYQPIQSQLTDSHQALDIVAALLAVYPFEQLYIADLDAIQKLGGTYKTNYNVIRCIQKRYPNLKLWVDAGISNSTELNFWVKSGVKLVIGSENFARLDNYLVIKKSLHDNFILSLDLMPQGYQGPIELFEKAIYWPNEVIVMSLANVGANLGVNTPLISDIKQRSANTQLYAAGGVRSVEDLNQLALMGVSGTLVASALHQKQLTSVDCAIAIVN
ncbi:MAG: HisA/HisF-related TIM barrel protein [Methylophilaceae bacterium]